MSMMMSVGLARIRFRSNRLGSCRQSGLSVVPFDSGIDMPEDRPDQDTFEDGTSFLFGTETPRKTSGDELAGEPPSTGDIAQESSRSMSPATASTFCKPFDPATESPSFPVPSDTARAPESGRIRTLMSGPQPGDLLFGRFRVERLLGAGGMGKVWLVHHEILHDQFALKVINPGAAIDDETVKRFVLEAQVMRALSGHPHAVVVHDADIDVDGRVIYIVMDVVHGSSIDKLLRPGVAMPLDWTTEVLGQLCDVLHQAHEKGIVHRDLSPSNLMLDDRPDEPVHLRVLDFGIAKVLDPESGVFDSVPLTENGRFYGKRSYASPEQINCEPVDSRSDIYSIGVILYELLTGYRPFQGGPTRLLQDHRSADPPSFAKANSAVKLPEQVERVVRRCLAKDPAHRPQSAPELYELFRAAALETEPCASPESRKENGQKPSVISADDRHSLPAWRAWLTGKAAIIGLAVLVCLALASLVPRLSRLWPPPLPSPILPEVVAIPPEVSEFLKDHELRPISGTGIAMDGFPKGVERAQDRRRLVWHQGVYLAEGYHPDLDKGRVGLLPHVLVSKNGSRRFTPDRRGRVHDGCLRRQNQRFRHRRQARPPCRTLELLHAGDRGHLWRVRTLLRGDGA